MIERSDDHQYRRVIEGEDSPWVPGVTSITKMLPKYLVQWAANVTAQTARDDLTSMIDSRLELIQGSDYAAREWYDYLRSAPDRVRDKAASLGTRVHHYAEHKLAGQEPIFADDVEPYAQQYIAGFLEKYSPTPIAREFYVWGGDYGGTADLYAEISRYKCPVCNQKPVDPGMYEVCDWLIDYKTSTKRITRSGFPYADTALQLAGLGWANVWEIDGEEQDTPQMDHYGVLAITPDQCELIEYDVTDAEWDTFRALKAVKTWKDTREKGIKA